MIVLLCGENEIVWRQGFVISRPEEKDSQFEYPVLLYTVAIYVRKGFSVRWIRIPLCDFEYLILFADVSYRDFTPQLL